VKLASYLYVPPPSVYPSALAILENLRRFPPAHDLVVFSEYPHDWPGLIRLKVSPDVVKKVDGTANFGGRQDFRPSNVVFLTGLQLVRDLGYDFVIVLEADCRVGRAGWDTVMFEEFFNLGRPCIAAGSLAFYNPANFSGKALKKWQAVVAKNTARNFPCPTYGWVGAAQQHPSCVFPNGALSILDMDWMKRFFTLENAVAEAVNMGPWDMVIGTKVWDQFAEDAYEVTGQLQTIFSSYGDIITTEESRMAWLRRGEIVGVHQVKSMVQP
jgi:hypothetical protein